MRRVPRDVLVYRYRWRAGAPELLMLRRAPDRGDFWHWISGAPQPGESDREAAIREVLEKTGLDVAATIFALGYRYAYPLRPQRRERWLELYGPRITRIPVETFGAEAPVRRQPEARRRARRLRLVHFHRGRATPLLAGRSGHA